jgi:hypothetical protein
VTILPWRSRAGRVRPGALPGEVWAKQADQGPNSLVGGARASRFLLIGGITPRNTKIGQVRLPGGRGSGDNGRSTFEVDEKKFLYVISKGLHTGNLHATIKSLKGPLW